MLVVDHDIDKARLFQLLLIFGILSLIVGVWVAVAKRDAQLGAFVGAAAFGTVACVQAAVMSAESR